MPAPGIPYNPQPPQKPVVSGATGSVLSTANLSIYQTLVNAGYQIPGVPPATTSTTTPPAQKPAPAEPLFQKIFGIDLTSAMFVVVGIVVVIVALNIFFAQAAVAVAPTLIEVGKTAAKAAVVA